MYYSCKLFYFPALLYFRAAVSACLYARLSCLHCQTLAVYMTLSDKLNDDDEDDTGTSRGLCIQLWDSFDACGVSSCGIWAPLG